jgi:hypothetical protein
MTMDNAAKLNSFSISLCASNEGRGTAQPTIIVDVKASCVKTENIEKLLDGFHGLLYLMVEVQETIPSRL